MDASATFASYLRGLDFLDKKSDFSKFKAAYSETNAWKTLPKYRRPPPGRLSKLETKLKNEATAALEIQKLLVALGIDPRALSGYTRTTWAAAYDARSPPATDKS